MSKKAKIMIWLGSILGIGVLSFPTIYLAFYPNNNSHRVPSTNNTPELNISNTNLNDDNTKKELYEFYSKKFRNDYDSKWNFFVKTYKDINIDIESKFQEQVDIIFKQILESNELKTYSETYKDDLVSFRKEVSSLYDQSYSHLMNCLADALGFDRSFINQIIDSWISFRTFKKRNQNFVKLLNPETYLAKYKSNLEILNKSNLFKHLINSTTNNQADLYNKSLETLVNQAIDFEILQFKKYTKHIQNFYLSGAKDDASITIDLLSVEVMQKQIGLLNNILTKINLPQLKNDLNSVKYYRSIMSWVFRYRLFYDDSRLNGYDWLFNVYLAYHAHLNYGDRLSVEIFYMLKNKYSTPENIASFANWVKKSNNNMDPDFDLIKTRIMFINYYVLDATFFKPRYLERYHDARLAMYNNFSIITDNIKHINRIASEIKNKKNFNSILNDIKTNIKYFKSSLKLTTKREFESSTNTYMDLRYWTSLDFWIDEMDDMVIDMKQWWNVINNEIDAYPWIGATIDISNEFKQLKTNLKGFIKYFSDIENNYNYIWPQIFNMVSVLLSGSNNLFDNASKSTIFNNVLPYYLSLNILNELCQQPVDINSVMSFINTSISTYNNQTNNFDKTDTNWLNDVNNIF